MARRAPYVCSAKSFRCCERVHWNRRFETADMSLDYTQCQADKSAVSGGVKDQGAEEVSWGMPRENRFRPFWKPSPVLLTALLSARGSRPQDLELEAPATRGRS